MSETVTGQKGAETKNAPNISQQKDEPVVAELDMKLEVVVLPVSGVDRAKEFYARLGWRLDRDFRFVNGLPAVQLTPQFEASVGPARPRRASCDR
jgi:hypothetical protein